MNESTRYAKFVAWSDEDQCYIGTCPGLFYGGCHGDDERQVLDELWQIADEVIAPADCLCPIRRYSPVSAAKPRRAKIRHQM
jgi:hypothetical protein